MVGYKRYKYMTLHPVIGAVAERYKSLDEAIRTGSLDLSSAISKFSWVQKDNSLGLGNLAAAVPTEADDKVYSIPFVISVLREDRDGDVVVPLGCQLRDYDLNPVVFFGHQSNPIPVAKSKSPEGKLCVFPEENRIKAIAFFDEHDEDAMFIYGKVKRGFLNASSIAFVPIEAYRREHEEKAQTHNGNSMPLGWLFKQYSLTEWSIVGVPSNAGAIRDSLDSEKSFITPQLQNSLSNYAAQSKGCWGGWCPTCPCEEKTVKMIEKKSHTPLPRSLPNKLSKGLAERNTSDGGVIVSVCKPSQDIGEIGKGTQANKPLIIPGRGHTDLINPRDSKGREFKIGDRVILDDGTESKVVSIIRATGEVRVSPGYRGKPNYTTLGQQLTIKGSGGSGKRGTRIEMRSYPTNKLSRSSSMASKSSKSCGCASKGKTCSCKKGKAVTKYITHNGDKWTVHAESGKVLGTHASKESAEAQLRAVEANKHKGKKSLRKFSNQADIESNNSNVKYDGREEGKALGVEQDDEGRWYIISENGQPYPGPGAQPTFSTRGQASVRALELDKKRGSSRTVGGRISGKSLSESAGTLGGYLVDVGGVGVDECPRCSGSGNCPACDGTGEIDQAQCPECKGSGECPLCIGTGKVEKSKQSKGKPMPRKASNPFRVGMTVWDDRDTGSGSTSGKVLSSKPNASNTQWIVKVQWLNKDGSNGAIETVTGDGLKFSKSIKRKPVINKTKPPVRKGKKDIEEDAIHDKNLEEDAVHKGDIEEDGTHEKDMENEGNPEEVKDEETFTPKPSAEVVAGLYSHAKSESDHIDEKLKDMDHPGVSEALEKYKEEHVTPRLDALKGIMEEHHPDHDIEEMSKGMEADDSMEGENLEGEEGLVDEGNIPEEDVDGNDAAAFDGEETPEEEAMEADEDVKGEDPDTDEILERYQHRGKWYTRKVGTVRRLKDGRKFLVKTTTKKDLQNMGNPAEQTHGKPGAGEGQTILGTGHADIIKEAAEHLEDAAQHPETPSMHKSAHMYHSKALGQVHKELTDEGHVEEDGGAGSPLSNMGNPAETKALKPASPGDTRVTLRFVGTWFDGNTVKPDPKNWQVKTRGGKVLGYFPTKAEAEAACKAAGLDVANPGKFSGDKAISQVTEKVLEDRWAKIENRFSQLTGIRLNGTN